MQIFHCTFLLWIRSYQFIFLTLRPHWTTRTRWTEQSLKVPKLPRDCILVRSRIQGTFNIYGTIHVPIHNISTWVSVLNADQKKSGLWSREKNSGKRWTLLKVLVWQSILGFNHGELSRISDNKRWLEIEHFFQDFGNEYSDIHCQRSGIIRPLHLQLSDQIGWCFCRIIS